MVDPFRAKLEPYRGTGRYPLKKVLPFYAVMLLLGEALVWLLHEQWAFIVTPPLYEKAQLTGVGTNGKAGPVVWGRTEKGRLLMLRANRSVLDNCRIGAPVRLQRRGDALALTDPACPR